MADKKRWFKVWTSILSDDDFDCSTPNGRDRLARFVWIGAYSALHGESGKTDIVKDFLLSRLGVTDMSQLIDTLTCKNVLFEEGKNRHGKLSVTVEKWVKYQEDSTQAERAAASRAKRRGEETRPDKNRKEEILAVISKINELSGKKYRADAESVNKYLLARLGEGATRADCILLVEDRWRRWKDKPDMREHFNPVTLFRPSHFETYLTEAGAHRDSAAKTPQKKIFTGHPWKKDWKKDAVNDPTKTKKMMDDLPVEMKKVMDSLAAKMALVKPTETEEGRRAKLKIQAGRMDDKKASQ